MDIRGGLIYDRRTGYVVGYAGDLAKSGIDAINGKDNMSPNEIASKISQFFITSFDGKISIPIYCTGFNTKVDQEKHLDHYFEVIKQLLKDCSPEDYQFEIKALSSDGWNGNLQFAKKHGIPYLGDFSHLCKRLRNDISNNTLRMPSTLDPSYKPVLFNMQTLVEKRKSAAIRGTDEDKAFVELLADGALTSPSDKMEMELGILI